jgi:peptidoglycan/xylan/chitin deacetylase (PgdA/CDA1 family)
MDINDKIIGKFFKNLKQIVKRGNKIVIFLNYHRIGSVDSDNPFHRLHTVSTTEFESQVKLASMLGNIVSLDEIQDYSGLGKVNFAVTFDDVSHSVLSVREYMTKQNFPYAIAPCTGITDRGYGTRDKVYCILKFLDEKMVADHVRGVIEEDVEIDWNSFSFYRFTKGDQLDPHLMKLQVIDPLYDTIPAISLDLATRNYLSWDEIRDNFLCDPLVTIANHSQEHMNMTCLSRAAIAEDIQRSYEVFERELGFLPKHFVVPFGGVSQNLIYDLNEYLRPYGCKSVLWVSSGLNLIQQPNNHQIMHFSRIHTPPTMLKFIYQLLKSPINTYKTMDDFIPYKPASETTDEKQVLSNNSPSPAVFFENLVRYGKNYASDENFYHYCFSNNPYKLDRPDYYTVVQNDRVTTIGYNFHMEFLFDGKPVSGVYWANWRKSPRAERGSGKMVVRKALDREPVIAIYHPSSDAQGATEIKWFPVKIALYSFFVIDIVNLQSDSNSTVKVFDSYPDVMTAFLDKVNQSSFFSISRSPKFFRWRFDQYPLAKVSYFLSISNGTLNGYFVVLHVEKRASISDFFCESPEIFATLLDKVHTSLGSKGIKKITIETSKKWVMSWLEENLDCSPDYFENVYGFNAELFPDREFLSRAEREWRKQEFHETQACGDVLIR